MRAVIYRPTRTAMQAGLAGTRDWILESEAAPYQIDPLMGWSGSRNTERQVRLRFATREAAVEYAERNGIAYGLREPQKRQPRPKSYADNYRADRLTPFTH